MARPRKYFFIQFPDGHIYSKVARGDILNLSNLTSPEVQQFRVVRIARKGGVTVTKVG